MWPILRLALSDGATVAEAAETTAPEPGAVARRKLTPISPIAWDRAYLSEWRSASKVLSPDSANDQAMMLYALFEALDEPLVEDDWRSLVGTRATAPTVRGPSVELWFGLKRAAVGGRKGETILRSLVMLGEGGLANTDPIVLGTVVRSLAQVGLVAEARALAVDAVLAAGL
jgi:hypothetical protein